MATTRSPQRPQKRIKSMASAFILGWRRLRPLSASDFMRFDGYLSKWSSPYASFAKSKRHPTLARLLVDAGSQNRTASRDSSPTLSPARTVLTSDFRRLLDPMVVADANAFELGWPIESSKRTQSDRDLTLGGFLSGVATNSGPP